jgi:pyruvate kinase
MVTMPSEAAADPRVARDLVERGMDCARINCAHDGPHAWAAMVDNVRKAAAEAGRPCRILMDLAGPKLRTGPLSPSLV